MINPHGLNDKDSFFYLILYTIRYFLRQKIEPCTNEDEIRLDVNAEIFDEIYWLKENMRLHLDVLNFGKQCFQINHILNKNNFFERVFELKEKFRCLIKQDRERKNVIRELSLCIFEKFNSFNIVRLEFDRKLRQKMLPINIVYKPVKTETENIDFFFLGELTWPIELRLTKMKKIGTEQFFSVISVLISMEEKINLIDILKTAQVDRVTYTILTRKIC